MVAVSIDTGARRNYSSGNVEQRPLKRLGRRVSESASAQPQTLSAGLGEQSWPSEPAIPTQPQLKFDNSSPQAQAQAEKSRKGHNHWRTYSLEKERQLTALERENKTQTRTIANLTSRNIDLKSRFTDALSTGKTLFTRFRELTAKYDTLANQYSEANRTVMRLQKSDRAKSKVHQHNLRLKATMRAHVCNKEGREDALLEALALANERIEELERAGETLLDALDKERDGGEGMDGEEEGEEEYVGALGAEAKFRGLVEDEDFREQKALWGAFLED